MYQRRITHYPALGKNAELRAALEERGNTAHSSGGPRHGLQQQVYGPEVTFATLTRFENLADLEAYVAAAPSDPTRQAQTAKIQTLISRPLATELQEILVMREATAEPAKYLLRTTYWAALGMATPLRQALEQRAQQPAKGSIGATLVTQVGATEGTNYTLTRAFASLAGMQEFRETFRADMSNSAWQAEVAKLQARPSTQQMTQVLVPINAPR